ncbi:hypothetical protein [Musicola keenii]|uniref:hypothetical protein n=1 Tax=Musicola keenii TaxID=2884250 RepID=UPI00177C905B|nr:hypothetical protein [Musicola keenii]
MHNTLTIDADWVRFSTPDVVLTLGYRAIARRFFHRDIPSPYEVEMAIAAIEDTIQATPTLHHVASHFACADGYLAAIAHSAGVNGPLLTQQQIENVFNRVADVIAGSPKYHDEFPDGADFISYLVIVRELSHHLNIQQITLTGAAT